MSTEIQTIQKHCSISNSLIWKQWEATYKKATFKDLLDIPHGISSAQFYAESLVELAIAFIRNGITNGDIDPAQRIYILETGSGTGVFALRFLRHLKNTLELLGLGHVRFCYVITDGSEVVLDALQGFSDFEPFIKAGEVDFGHLKVDQFLPITLRLSGFLFGETPLQNPLIVTSSYFFDSMPYDVFKIQNHQLVEMRETLATPQSNYPNGQLLDIKKVVSQYDPFPVTYPHYHDEQLDQILKDYTSEFSELTFSISKPGFDLMKQLLAYSNGKLMQCIGDLSLLWTEAGPTSSYLYPSREPLSWTNVNLNAIERFAKLKGGFSYLIPGSVLSLGRSFEQLYVVYGLDIARYPDVRYQLMRIQNNPSYEINNLKMYLKDNMETLTAEMLLTILELTRADILNISDVLLRLQTLVGSDANLAKPYNRKRIVRLLSQFFENTPSYYHRADWIRFILANISNSCKDYSTSIRYFASCNIADFSEHNQWVYYFNQGNAFRNLGQLDQAIQSYEKALAVKPDDADTLEMIISLKMK